ncbi:aminopeptidase P family protein [Ruminococcus sp. Marseille-P6503]|uniref:aminopeptidase P family protein n=1 Tax=Ruminococcus sp. Marseille-P6503 TaxID=2364796 RepID=UPI000F52961D|nr:aminopeptidase P family protein [Ruminococcus sp. Marseille-P6503]
MENRQEYFSPLELLRRKLGSFSDCAVITGDINRRYFTQMKSSAGTLVVFSEKAYLIIDFRYIEKARKTARDCEVILQDNLYEQINKLLKKHNAGKVSVEADNMTISQLSEFSDKLDCGIDSSRALSECIGEIRVCKRVEEIEKITAAQRIAEKAFEHILDYIKIGRTEREIALELDYFMLRNGAEALSFDTIALSGKITSLPHGVPSDKKVENGDFVLMDYGAVVDGWHSDMTRTVCAGQPSDEMIKVYDIVLRAQLAGLSAVKAGISGAELDKTARGVIEAEGYGGYFGHALGHGVGMEIHEAPTASPSCKNVLEKNMIVTVEPGIYIPEKFGVRIEDFAVVAENGCKNLTKAPKELIIL